MSTGSRSRSSRSTTAFREARGRRARPRLRCFTAGPRWSLASASDPDLADNVDVLLQWMASGYVTLNIAQPPFDDVHVRKAVSLAVDKQALRQAAAGYLPEPWVPVTRATHIAPDFLQNNLLLEYDPYATPDDRGDLDAARAEMAAVEVRRRRRRALRRVHLLGRSCRSRSTDPSWRRADRERARAPDRARDRAGLHASRTSSTESSSRSATSGSRSALAGFATSRAAAAYFPAVFHSLSIPPFCCNWLPRPERALTSSRAGVTRPPRFRASTGSSPNARHSPAAPSFQCWAELDQLLMEEVVPCGSLAPRRSASRVASERVVESRRRPGFPESLRSTESPWRPARTSSIHGEIVHYATSVATAGVDPRIGTELAGYLIEALAGRGGMGVVYRAHHLHLERRVALKVLVPELADDPGFRERFLPRVAGGGVDRPQERHPDIRRRRGGGRLSTSPCATWRAPTCGRCSRTTLPLEPGSRACRSSAR